MVLTSNSNGRSSSSNGKAPHASKKNKAKNAAASTSSSSSSSSPPSNSASCSTNPPEKRRLSRSSIACQACRKLKMKCSGASQNVPCIRCARIGRDCILIDRPRKKPTTRKDLEIEALKSRLKEVEGRIEAKEAEISSTEHLQDFETTYLPEISQKSQSENSGLHNGLEAFPSHPPHQPLLNGDPIPPAMNHQSHHMQQVHHHASSNPRSEWFDTILSSQTFPPSSSNQTALAEIASLPTSSHHYPVLSPVNSISSHNTPHSITSIQATEDRRAGLSRLQVSTEDRLWLENHKSALPFLRTNSLSVEDAIGLYKSFMCNCAIHTALLDPDYNSISIVSGTSDGFLFASIVFLAGGYDEREHLQASLQDEMDALIGRIIVSGEKSIAIVQAFLLLAWWLPASSNPATDRTWLFSGIALRLAAGLNLFRPPQVSRSEQPETVLEKLNRERTWLLSIAVDRSLSAARGQPWSLRGDDPLCRNAETWGLSQPENKSWDKLIGSLIDLLRVQSRHSDILKTSLSAYSDANEDVDFDCDTMMRIMNDELEQHRIKCLDRGIWISPLEISAKGNRHDLATALEQAPLEEYEHHYLCSQSPLRWNYAVLILNCFGLQYCAQNPKRAACKSFCIARAIDAARNVVNAMTNALSYAPVSQFAIISFALITLIKLASLKKEDEVVSSRLLKLVESGIKFLEKVSLHPTHTPARCASLLRAILRRQKENHSQGRPEKPAFEPGMEEHSFPLRSSRAASPNRTFTPLPSHQPSGSGSGSSGSHLYPSGNTSHPDHQSHQITTPSSSRYFEQPNNPQPHPQYADTLMFDLGLYDPLSSDDSLPYGVFGNDGSFGFDRMKADEVLDDNFWLKLP